jgi:hypothetical protein
VRIWEMIKVTDNNNNIIYYSCGCGTKGMCTVKPMDKDVPLVIEVSCPNCEASERMVLSQHGGTINDMDLSWGMTLDNKELEEEE